MKARVVTLAVLVLLAPAAGAQDEAAQFYRGKTITMLITNGVGGGFDAYGRHIARFIGKFIAGEPKIVVQNMQGAGGVTGANWINTVAAKDGTVLGATHPSALLEPILGDRSRMKYDPVRFQYIGNANADVFTCVIRADAPVKTFADTFTTEAIVGAAGDAASLRDMPTLLNSVLGSKFRIVSDYDGSRAIQFAIERGEIHGQCGVAWSAISSVHPDWFKSGLVKVLVQEEMNGHPHLNALGVPKSVDFAKTDEQRRILELGYAQEIIGRPYFMVEEVPRERVDAVRKGFAAMFGDAAFIAESKRLGLDIDWMDGAGVQRHIEKVFATPPGIIAKTRKALRPDG